MKKYEPIEFKELTPNEFTAFQPGLAWRGFKQGDLRKWGEESTDDDGVTTRAEIDLYQHMIDSGLPIQEYVAPEPTAAELKLIGVEYDGVMCSATAKDQFGLQGVRSYIERGFTPPPFEFENGNKYPINGDNVDAFEAVWLPFRMSFFT